MALYNPDQDGSDSPRSSLNNSLSDQSLASVNLNSVGSVHSYTPVRPGYIRFTTNLLFSLRTYLEENVYSLFAVVYQNKSAAKQKTVVKQEQRRADFFSQSVDLLHRVPRIHTPWMVVNAEAHAWRHSESGVKGMKGSLHPAGTLLKRTAALEVLPPETPPPLLEPS